MEIQAIALLQEVRTLTRQGKLAWVKNGSDRFEATASREIFCVEFLFLARTDETGSDRTIARLSAFGLVLDYCIGTQGFDLICAMLAMSDPTWLAHRELGQKRLVEAMKFLRRMYDTG